MPLNILPFLGLFFILYEINFSYSTSIQELSNQTEPYENCINHLINSLFLADETIDFITENQRNIWVPPTIRRPFMVHVLEKPTKLFLKSYGNYILYADDIDSLDFTLGKLKNSNIWDISESSRETYVVVTTSKQLKQIFKVFWNFDITNMITVSLIGTKGSPKRYTYSLINCRSGFKINFIKICSGNSKIFFNRKLRNLTVKTQTR